MTTILIVVLIIILLGGGFGYWRGNFSGAGPGIGILGLILVILLVVWLVGGPSFSLR